MQLQVYKIDETQLNRVRNKAFFRAVKIILPLMVVIVFFQYLSWPNSIASFLRLNLLVTLCLIPFVFIPIYIGTNKLKRSYATLEIILNDIGIESKAEMMPYKLIKWENLAVQEKANGITILHDKSVSRFTHWFNGSGKIVILPEMLNKDQLISEIYKHSYSANYRQ